MPTVAMPTMTIPTTAISTMAMPTMAMPTTHLEQALLKATLKVSKTESYTIELDATKARYTLLCYYATMPPRRAAPTMLPCDHATMLLCYYVYLEPPHRTKAAAGRDAFVKAIYQRIFDLLVRR